MIVGAGDGRHLISTFANLESGSNPELLVLEQSLMTYARQILFLGLVQDVELGSSPDVARMILELFGNVSLRKKTAQYLRKKSADYLEVVANLASKVSFFLVQPWWLGSLGHHFLIQ